MKMIYSSGDTLFHHIDAYSKFIWSLIIAVWLMTIRDLPSVAVANCLIFATVYFGANISFTKYIRLVSFVSFGGIWLILYHGYFHSGSGIYVLGIPLSYQGMAIGLTIGLRTFGLVASGLAFSTTTSPTDLVTMFVQIGVPYRIAHVIYLGVRFITIFERDLQAIYDVQQLRGVTKRRNKFIKSLVAMLATQLRRVDETAIALETRAFGLYETQTILNPVYLTMKGILLLGISIIVILGYSILF